VLLYCYIFTWLHSSSSPCLHLHVDLKSHIIKDHRFLPFTNTHADPFQITSVVILVTIRCHPLLFRCHSLLHTPASLLASVVWQSLAFGSAQILLSQDPAAHFHSTSNVHLPRQRIFLSVPSQRAFPAYVLSVPSQRTFPAYLPSAHSQRALPTHLCSVPSQGVSLDASNVISMRSFL
jgi:hypothetical protein